MPLALCCWALLGAGHLGLAQGALALRAQTSAHATAALARSSGGERRQRRGAADCQLLEKGIVLDPKASCKHVELTLNETGCSCRVPLPRSVVPQPDVLSPALGQTPGAVTFPPVPMFTPAPDSGQPYRPPVTAPECPFGAACKASANPKCVGFDSWGFDQVIMSSFSPASAYLRTITCTYTLRKGENIRVPPRVQAMWARRQNGTRGLF
uniref:CUB domain-containing protein n=1 Tax=Alexandrium monilatum TaxID=311494 RepID=A0A7S4VAE6_9DINO